MDNKELLNQARVEEFWEKYLLLNTYKDSNTFFGGANQKKDDIETVERTYLAMSDIERVKELCNDSDVLLYTFLSKILSMLLARYEEENELLFLSPLNQFSAYNKSDEIFFFKSKIDFNLNFKELFSLAKKELSNTIKYSLPWSVIDKDFKTKISDNSAQFGLVIGQTCNSEIAEISNTLFLFNLEEGEPYLETRFRGKMFCSNAIKLFGDNFKKSLKEVICNLYQPIDELEFRGDMEKAILAAFNPKKPYFPLNKNIIELLDAQSLNNDAIAIRHNEEQLTYDELYKCSNQFSIYLTQKFKFQKDDLFGIMLPRSINMITSIYSVWKSGAAYVPIAIDLSGDQLLQIIEDSGLKAIITDNQDAIHRIEELGIQIPIIDLNLIHKEVGALPNSSVKSNIQFNDLAYVIYTSGSTGVPKGVMIEHLGMLNHIGSKIEEIGIKSYDLVAQNAPHTFDISIWQFFSSLIVGGTCVIYDKEVIADVKEFITGLILDKITVLELVPSYLLEMLNYFEEESDKIKLALKIIILNAETLTKSMVERWLFLYPDIPIVNTYGATEVSDDISHYIMTEIPDSYSVPVMKETIQNFELHIVNEDLKPVPIGVKGEILIAGLGVGRGYINDLEKTAKSFLKGPISGITNYDRIYRTGDLGKFMADNTMEFIGRNDNQVKILGHRIELDAIENIVSNINAIKNCKALAFPDRDMIVLYYLSDKRIENNLFEDELLERLPKYMVPSLFIHLNSFPLTNNGKVDKKALPDPLELGMSKPRGYVAPRNDIDKKIVALWEKILNGKNIGIKDDFFELGGHSLKLNRLKNEYYKNFEVKIELKDLFENSTIETHVNIIESASKTVYEIIEKVELSKNYPVSDAQRRLWILSQFGENSAVYNMPGCIDLAKDCDINSFLKAIDFTIDRHEILRTVFEINETGEVKQKILSQENLNFVVNFLDFGETENAEIKVQEYLSKDAYKLFDLEKGPLLRASIFILPNNLYRFYYNIHHIISDGWSTDVLTRDILGYYDAFRKGGSHNLPKLRIQYKDYASWQIEQLNKKENSKHLSYWLDQLSGELPVLDLPTSKLRPTVKTHNGRRLETYISNETTNRLRSFNQEQGGSLFFSLLATWNILFYNYTSQKDIIIGSPLAGRDHIDLEDQIGFYVNTLAFRNQVDSNDSFISLYNKVKKSTLEGYAHQMVPFDKLVDRLEINRDTSRSVVFDVMLNLQNKNEEKNDFTLQSDQVNQITDTGTSLSKFDIDINFKEVGDYLQFGINYNTDVYDKEMVEGLMRHYKKLLSEILANPNIEVGSIDYLTAEDKHILFSKFNDTYADFPRNKSIVDLFESQLLKTPSNVAIRIGEETLSYKELNVRVNQFANYLNKKGVQQEDIVGLFLERSFDMMITILGVIKAGASYLPIDPNYPRERIEYILFDAVPKVIICEASNRTHFEKFSGEIILIDHEKNNIQKESSQNPNYRINPNNLLNIIYTSGSTGFPKGVMNQHNGLVNRLLWAKEFFNVSEKDTFLQKTTYCFDVSVWELLLPLISGAKLVFANVGGEKDSQYLKNIIETNGITTIHFVPSMLEVFLLDIQNGDCNHLEKMICSGETLKLRQVQQVKEKLPYVAIYNLYGPTEAAIDVTCYKIPDSLEGLTQIPIGFPIENTKIHILNNNRNIVPIGVIGEIYIEGVQVARGYLNKKELTEERFVKNPFDFDSPEKFYKTGDLAKWSKDGSIEYLGRIDNQVKIRGYRIELGEIEAVLDDIQDVLQSIVIAREDTDSRKFLVAYVVSGDNYEKTNLQTILRSRLPEYMVPSFIMELEVLPVLENGKINRKALPSPELNTLIKSTYKAPQTELEILLTDIYAKVLGAKKVGINDSFYELGGTSLKSILVTTHLRDQGYSLQVAQILKTPVISELTKYVQKLHVLDVTKEKGKETIEPIPLSENQLIYFEEKHPRHAIGYFHIILPSFDKGHLKNVITKVCEDIPALRSKIYLKNGGLFQVPIPKSEYKPVLQFNEIQDITMDMVVEEYFLRSRKELFDLANGEGIHFYVCHDSERAVVQIVIHHSITDASSNEIIKIYIQDLYYKNPHTFDLLGDDYYNFSKALEEFVTSSDYHNQLKDLEKTFFDLLKIKECHFLPLNYFEKTHKQVVAHKYQITGDKFEDIKKFCEQNNLLLSSFILSLICTDQHLRDTSTRAFIIETVIAGNSMSLPGFNPIGAIGQFTSIIPLCVHFREEKPLANIFEEIQRSYISTKANQQIPYSKINAAFKEKSKHDLKQFTLGSYNYVDFSANKLPEYQDADENYIIETMEKLNKQNYPIIIKCTVYSDGFVLVVSREEDEKGTNAESLRNIFSNNFLETILKSKKQGLSL